MVFGYGKTQTVIYLLLISLKMDAADGIKIDWFIHNDSI